MSLLFLPSFSLPQPPSLTPATSGVRHHGCHTDLHVCGGEFIYMYVQMYGGCPHWPYEDGAGIDAATNTQEIN